MLDIGKRTVFIWEENAGEIHEEDAALRMAAMAPVSGAHYTAPSEGKVLLLADTEGMLRVDTALLAAINRMAQPDLVSIDTDLALIAVVGRGMKDSRGTAGRVFASLAHARINVRMIDQGSDEENIIIGVKNDDFEAAIRAIYQIFVDAQI